VVGYADLDICNSALEAAKIIFEEKIACSHTLFLGVE
jgi:hypothetical protein